MGVAKCSVPVGEWVWQCGDSARPWVSLDGSGERYGGLVLEGAGAGVSDGKDQAGDGRFYHTVSSELRPG